MKYSVLLGLMIFTMMEQSAFAESMETNICIKNTTSVPHKIDVTDIHNYNWDGGSRPDHNFNDLTIAPDQTICNREEVNAMRASVTFTFLIDGVPSKMDFRATYRWSPPMATYYKYKDWRWGIRVEIANPFLVPSNNTIYWQPFDWRPGFECSLDKAQCSLFEIR